MRGDGGGAHRLGPRARREWIGLIACVITALVLVPWVVLRVMGFGPWTFTYGQSMDTPRAAPPTRTPDQVFPIHGGYVLQVYDPEPGEETPTVALWDCEGRVRWCVYATRRSGGAVSRIRFTRVSKPLFRCPRVIGWSDSAADGPHEGSLWMIGQDGRLAGYWDFW